MERRRNGMPIMCDHCGGPIIKGHELVLNNKKKWAEIVKRSKSQFEPKYTLLCPECIEALNGGPLRLFDLLCVWHKGFRKSGTKFIGAVPMNLWYYQQKGMMEKAKPFILRHLQSCEAARKCWNYCGIKEEDLL